MQKTTFKISKMDCPSEENLIRMKLDGIPSIKNLDFDIPNRKLTVFHSEQVDPIEKSIIELNLGEQKLETEQTPTKLNFQKTLIRKNYFGQFLLLTFLSS